MDPGDHGLTAAELDVLLHLVEGASNAEIARRRNCSIGTVKVHLVRIFKKLHVENRTQAVLVGERLGAIRQMRLRGNAGKPFELSWWLPHATSESRRHGEILFREGEPGDAMYYLQTGRVSLPELGVLLESGAVFGEIGVFSAHRKRTATARCDSPVRLFRLNAERARDLCLENPMFALRVMQLASQRLSENRIPGAS